MVISRTPYRISLFGGGTDYPAWYLRHGGAVLSATIDKYCYLTCRYLPPFFEHRFRVVYSIIEDRMTVEEIRHPAAREVIRYLGIERGLEIHHDGDLPGRSGMGSSSAFTVGLLNALSALTGRMKSKRQLAFESIHVEQEVIKETVGSQDQVSAAYGGLNQITFFPEGDIDVRPIVLPPDRLWALNSHLLLFYTGIKRTAAGVAATYVDKLGERAEMLHRMRGMVDRCLEVLVGGEDLTIVGSMLHEAWLAKRSLSSQVSNSVVDGYYEQARAAGALGGKLLGAGGGGFLLCFAPPERHARIREALSHLIHVPFRLERSGSQIIFFDEEENFDSQDRDRAARRGATRGEISTQAGASLPRIEPSGA